MAKSIKLGKYKMDECWDIISENAKDMVKRMLIVNPLDRITISEIKKHPWILEVL